MAKVLTSDNARAIADALGVRLYQRESGNPKSNAQRNLIGRTHYVDADTMRAFRSRIRTATTTDHGTVFMIVESVSADYRNQSRGFRFVAFDLTGTVLNDRASNDALHRTGDKADAAMWAWAESFDARSYYRDLMRERAAKAKADAVAMSKLARTI